MKNYTSAASIVLILGAALLAINIDSVPIGNLIASPLGAEQHYTSSGFLRDLCNQPSESAYVAAGSLRNAVVRLDSASYLLYGYFNSLDVFNVTSPMNPMKLKDQVQLPWLPDPGSSTHEGLVDHLRKFAVLDNFPYAFVGLYTYGWDFFDVRSQSWLRLGLAPTKVMPSGGGYSAGALFRGSSGRVYLAGQKLDQGSMSAGDNSIQIYDVTSPISYKVMRPVVTVPIGHAGDPAPYNTFPLVANLGLDVFQYNGRTYLAAVSRFSPQAAAVVDVTNPSAVTRAAMWTPGSSDGKLWQGAWAFDGPRNRLYAGTASDAVVYVFDTSSTLASGAAPVYMSTARWRGTSGGLNQSALALSGDLLAVWSNVYIGYLSLGSGDPLKLPDADGVTTLTRACSGPFGVSTQMFSPFTVAGDSQNVYVARSMLVYGDILQIGPGGAPANPSPTPTAPPANPTPSPSVGGCINPATGICTPLAPELGLTTCPRGWAPCGTQATPTPTPTPAVSPGGIAGCLAPDGRYCYAANVCQPGEIPLYKK